MSNWLFTWKGIVPGVVILLGALAFGIAFREGPLGNVASIVGLAVSVLGFVVTIWTVRDAGQQIQEASERSQKAIQQVREEARRTLEGIATQFLNVNCASLRSGVDALRQAAQDANWPRAVYRCQECRDVAYRLAEDHHLTGEETSRLRAAADDFAVIRRFIERNRLPGGEGTLQNRHVECLDEVIGLLAQIQARLLHGPLRPPQGASQNP